jgi:hypothetical protein
MVKIKDVLSWCRTKDEELRALLEAAEAEDEAAASTKAKAKSKAKSRAARSWEATDTKDFHSSVELFEKFRHSIKLFLI